jgi:class 3 adenylate cyclase
MVGALLRVEAAAAADKIWNFLDDVTGQLGSALQQPWSAGSEAQHRLDALRALRQTPAIVSITLLDGNARERLHVSRTDLNRIGSGIDRSNDPGVIGVRVARAWYGPVTYSNGSEPFMVIAVAGNRKALGIALADVNLKFTGEVVSAIRVGRTGSAFVLDQLGRLIAHPDVIRVLRGANDPSASVLRRLRETIVSTDGIATVENEGETVVASIASVSGVDWTVFVEQPLSEAFAPIYASLWRTGILLVGGAMLAGLLAYWLASRMTKPISLLEEGAERVGAGQFQHRILLRTGDQLETLADRFNKMAEELEVSQERSERIARLKRFLAPQVAELVEKTGDDEALTGQRAEVAVVFCDLRGFTTMSAQVEPEELMQILRHYHEALGSVVLMYEATVTSFSGDGVMLLLNAPVRCPEPAQRAVDMARAMQAAVQRLIADWRLRGREVGFGVGIAVGWATVGRIGFEGRLEYTAIGNVVNLAARLCASAEDGQILIDPVTAQSIRGGTTVLTELGTRNIKGYDRPVSVYDAGVRSGQSLSAREG